jgi:hypothetical protein
MNVITNLSILVDFRKEILTSIEGCVDKRTPQPSKIGGFFISNVVKERKWIGAMICNTEINVYF